MTSIQAGIYKVKDILDAASFDFKAKAAADYLDGNPDYRRVQISGLSFDDLDSIIKIPTTANEVVITVDGETDTVLDVTLSDVQKEERRLSFESAGTENLK